MNPTRPSQLSSLVEILRRRASDEPERQAYTFLINGEAVINKDKS